MKRTYIATWETITDGGGTESHHIAVESEDNPKAIIMALRDYGLSYQLAKPFGASMGTHIYEINKMMDSQELLESIGFDGDSFTVIDFLKKLNLP